MLCAIVFRNVVKRCMDRFDAIMWVDKTSEKLFRFFFHIQMYIYMLFLFLLLDIHIFFW